MTTQLITLARIGRDVELRYLTNGDAVANLALAYNYGKKGDNGKYSTQWVEATLWGKRAEALAQHLTKGRLILAYIQDIHIETYEGKNGTGTKLVGRIADIGLTPKPSDDGATDREPEPRAAAPRPPAPRPPAPRPPSTPALDDLDDDIPF